ncbi:MAG: tRNA adenosine(34) deaminase TadA [Pseudomonadota bacterium]
MTGQDAMARALELAAEAARAGEVPVGAVIVDEAQGVIVGEGANRPIAAHDPTAHAEIVAMRAAAERLNNYRLTGLHLYVTLEPCVMCAGAISHARLGALTFAATDQKGGAVCSGVKFFDQPTCHWRPTINIDAEAADEASQLLRDFFRARREK